MEASESKRLLKANDIRGLGAKVVFNFEDIRRRCAEQVERTRKECRELLELAQSEADAMRRTAHAEGHAEGQKQAQCDAEYEIARRAREIADRAAVEKLQTTLPAMDAAARQLAQQRDLWLAEWESTAVRLSIAIAEKLLRHELSVRPDRVRGMLAAPLELAAGTPQIRVSINPDDVARLGGHVDKMIRSMAACGEATVIPDPSISPGGCVIETQHGTIDATVETQLDRIAAELFHSET